MPPDRYHRQALLPFLGAEGQKRIGASTALVLGCGALGTVSAELLARAGVGRLRLVDRDCVEWTNLQRQMLFDEQDAREGAPKAVAAARKLSAINSQIQIEARVTDAHAGNLEELLDGVTVAVDGTDNFETRFLLNDASVKLQLPWVYGAAVASTGLTYTFLPGRTPCLRCLFDSAPPPGASPTCETAGVLGPLTAMIASIQAAEALKLCAGQWESCQKKLLSVDLWEGDIHAVDVRAARRAGECLCCGQRRFEYLEGRAATQATSLCGQQTVQLRPAQPVKLDLRALAAALATAAGVTVLNENLHLLRFRAPGGEMPGQELEVTVFPDGRALVHGTKQVSIARAACAKYLGS